MFLKFIVKSPASLTQLSLNVSWSDMALSLEVMFKLLCQFSKVPPKIVFTLHMTGFSQVFFSKLRGILDPICDVWPKRAEEKQGLCNVFYLVFILVLKALLCNLGHTLWFSHDRFEI